MVTTTRFTNNVVRAKAVKALNIKKASSKANSQTANLKHTPKLTRASVPAKTNLGQVAGGGKSHTIGGKGGNSYGGKINRDNQVIRSA